MRRYLNDHNKRKEPEILVWWFNAKAGVTVYKNIKSIL